MSLSDEQIDELLQSSKSNMIDQLAETDSIEKIAATLSAMANGQGGTLIFGRNSRLEDSTKVVNKVLQAALRLEPKLVIPMPYITEKDENEIVIAQVSAGMPHIYSLEGRYVCRKEASNQPLVTSELRRLLIERGEISFEMEVPYGATLDDLDWTQVDKYVRSVAPTRHREDVLLNRGCLIQRNGENCPTNAGILLFGTEPQRFIRNSELTAARFAGESMSDTFSRQDITGTLPEQIRKAETFLMDHLRKGVKIRRRMSRQEDYEYPMEAAREIVVNAVAHRDYSIQGDAIRLFLFKDRMEVTSPGELAGPVTIDNIKDERFSRNPAIVQVLSDMGYIERLGYGVDRVIELMQNQDLRAPLFTETKGGFKVVLYNREIKSSSAKKTEPKQSDEMPLNQRQEAALAYLRDPNNSRITNSELQRQFPDVHAETIRRDLADLVHKNLLQKMGQKRGSYYILSE